MSKFVKITKDRRERIVDLCIYVDKYLYDPQGDKEKIFDSIYKIVYSLAIKKHIFQRWEDYDPFCLYVTCRLFERASNPKQFLPDDHPKKMKKIKSILNFIKRVMYPMQVDYQKENFAQEFGNDYGDEASKYIKESLVKNIHIQCRSGLPSEFKDCLAKTHNITRDFLKSTPYGNDPLMLHNLYISCSLTLLNQFTLSNKNKNKLETRIKSSYNIEDFVNKIYIEEAKDSVILFHLDPTLKNYVEVLVNRIKKLILKDLRGLIGDAEPTDAVIQSILQSMKGDFNNNNDKE